MEGEGPFLFPDCPPASHWTVMFLGARGQGWLDSESRFLISGGILYPGGRFKSRAALIRSRVVSLCDRGGRASPACSLPQCSFPRLRQHAMVCSFCKAYSHRGLCIKLVQAPEKTQPLDGKQREAGEADSASGSIP